MEFSHFVHVTPKSLQVVFTFLLKWESCEQSSSLELMSWISISNMKKHDMKPWRDAKMEWGASSIESIKFEVLAGS